MDTLAVVQRALALVADLRCNDIDFPLFHLNFIVLEQQLPLIGETARYVWVRGPRKFARSFQNQEQRRWTAHHNHCAHNNDGTCARCMVGVRFLNIPWYQCDFRGHDEDGVHRVTLRATAHCVCGRAQCLGCVARVNWMRPVHGVTNALRENVGAIERRPADAGTETIDLSQDTDEAMSDVEYDDENDVEVEAEPEVAAAATGGEDTQAAATAVNVAPDGDVNHADVQMVLELARAANVTRLSYLSPRGLKLKFEFQ